MPALILPTTSHRADRQKRRQKMSLFPIAEKQTCTFLLGLLLFAWFVSSAATAMLLVALYFPGQGGLNALLQAFGYLLPSDPVIYAT
jgi:cell division septal protein FtsQ